MATSWLFQPHCVVLLVGPSGSGKTTFAEHLFSHMETVLGQGTCLYLGTDKIREQLALGTVQTRQPGTNLPAFATSLSRSSPQMMGLSRAAYRLLEVQCEAAMQYPVSKPCIVLDTNGLSEAFRNTITKLAKDHCYQVYAIVFDLELSELLPRIATKEGRTVAARQHQKLRRETFSQLKHFTGIYRCAKLPEDWHSQPIVVVGSEVWRATQLDPNVTWHIVGDVHACYATLCQLLNRLRGVAWNDQFQVLTLQDGVGLILAGDVVDKGPDLEAILRFVTTCLKHPRFKVVRGNHERRVYNALSGKAHAAEADAATPYADHVPWLRANVEWRDAFVRFFHQTLPFVQCTGTEAHHSSFVVTHAPCATKYLGKWDKRSVQHQVYYHYAREDYAALAQFLEQQSQFNAPWHVFGHVPVAESRFVGNHIPLDTGCSEGGRLTAVSISGMRPRTVSVADLQTQPSLDRPLRNIPHVRVGLDESTDPVENERSNRRIDQLLRDGINFISGTVSPAEATLNPLELESLAAGLRYFQTKKATRVVLQPKYMGSRCQMYLFPHNLDQSYAVSRNGHRIRWPSTEGFLQQCQILKTRLDLLNLPLHLAIIDCELVPWSVLGAGLIQKFDQYGVALQAHLDQLELHGFDEQLREDVAWCQSFWTEYQVKTSARKVVEAKLEQDHLGVHLYAKSQQIPRLQNLHIPTAVQRANLAQYQKQMDLYGMAGEAHVKPFEILKLVLQDGSERVLPYPPDQSFGMLQDEKTCVVDLTNWEAAFDTASQFFHHLCNTQNMEGVVIKALDGRAEVPFLKVRNPRYLHIIYNPNYQHALATFAKSKNTRRKLRQSELEWNLGLEMLKRPYAGLATDDVFRRLAVSFLAEEESAQSQMDERL